jgi:hypothetical protein
MAILNGARLKDILIKNVFNSKDSTDDDLIKDTFLKTSYVYGKTLDDAAASTATGETIFGPQTLVASKIVSLEYTSSANVATGNTDTVTITVKKRSSAGVATTIAAYTTVTAALVEFIPKAFTLPSNSDVNLAVGDRLTVTVAKAGSGLVLARGTLEAVVERYRYT